MGRHMPAHLLREMFSHQSIRTMPVAYETVVVGALLLVGVGYS